MKIDLRKKINIIQDDCLKAMRKLKDNSVDLVCIDPPYNIGKDKSWDKWKTVDGYVQFMGEVFKECERVLKDNGSFYFFHNDFLQIVELQNWLNNNSKLDFRQLITINKTNKSYIKQRYGSQNKFRNFINTNEYLLFYTFQDELGLLKNIPVAFKSYLKYMTKQKNLLGFSCKDFNDFLGYKSIASHWFYQDEAMTKQPQPRIIGYKDYLKLQKTGFFKKSYKSIIKDFKNNRYTFNKKDGLKNTWNYDFSKEKKTIHPTQKPISLIEDIIKYSSNEGDVVLDCFGGSGSTAVACKNLNRKCIIIEREPKYIKIIKERLNEK